MSCCEVSGMIFLCFSGKDRTKIVTSILYHLENHGFEVWFDNHQYIIGDDKVKKYTDAIMSCEYAIVIYSENFPDSPGAVEELAVIKERHQRGKMPIFPIFYNIPAIDVVGEYAWLCDMIYNEVADHTGTLLTCNQIVCKYYEDKIKKLGYQPIGNYTALSCGECFSCAYINRLLNLYENISASNINSKMSLLYCLALYLFEVGPADMNLLKKSANYLFDTTRLDLPYNFKEIILLEQICIILLGNYFSKHLQEF